LWASPSIGQFPVILPERSKDLGAEIAAASAQAGMEMEMAMVMQQQIGL
jgi:hypothetical protein